MTFVPRCSWSPDCEGTEIMNSTKLCRRHDSLNVAAECVELALRSETLTAEEYLELNDRIVCKLQQLLPPMELARLSKVRLERLLG